MDYEICSKQKSEADISKLEPIQSKLSAQTDTMEVSEKCVTDNLEIWGAVRQYNKIKECIVKASVYDWRTETFLGVLCTTHRLLT